MLRIGGWDWSNLSFQIPDSILGEIRSIPHSTTSNNGNDRLTWIGDNRGDFDLKSAYAMAIDCKVGDDKFSGTWVWKLKTLPRIKTFIWKCLHQSIGVGVCLVQRCLSESEVCPLCNNEAESILHRLRDCPFARNIWHRLGITPNSNFYVDDLQLWMENNSKDQSHKVRHQPPWKIIFPFAIWGIWKHSNNVIFRDHVAHLDFHRDIVFRALEFQHCVLDPLRMGNKTMVQVRWDKPQSGWTHLNTNGSTLGNPGDRKSVV